MWCCSAAFFAASKRMILQPFCLGASQELVGASDGVSVAGRCSGRRCPSTETCSKLLHSSSHWDATQSLRDFHLIIKFTYLRSGWMR